jgi:four helix bundle protein
MVEMQNFQKLDIWQTGHELALRIYQVTTAYPSAEQYGLVSQMRRSVAFIPTNIAEGSGRHSKPDFAQFIDIVLGSSSELHYQLILSHNLKYIDTATFSQLEAMLIEVQRMMYGFRSSLLKKS